MNNLKLELYWNDIPIGKENAITYDKLINKWNICERKVKYYLHELSSFDNGDDYVLIRSGKSKGFYRTDNVEEIQAYKRECLNKGKSVFAPVKKINRILNTNYNQLEIQNNLRVIREMKGLKQSHVCKQLKKYDKALDKSMLSKMENGICLPTPYQLSLIAKIYGCEPVELVNSELYL